MVREPSITICSVSFKSRPWLEINQELTSQLNHGTEFIWLVAENSPPESELSLTPEDSRFQVHPGADFERRVYASGSYHHGRAMNLLPQRIKTRFALFCDPDYYIVKVGWIQEVLEHMATRKLAVFGAPWHPKWVYKNRYFPCVHCMFVDLERVAINELDFEPDYARIPGHARNSADDHHAHAWGKLPDPLKFRKRRYVGTSRDVSWRIATRLGAVPDLGVECLQPVFHPRGERLARSIDWALPDRLALVPKKRNYYSPRGFRDHGLPDLEARGWEEFLWHDEPFGFHVRLQPKLKAEGTLDRHLDEVKEVLRAFLA